ncbi:unnamed protein product [Prorocentrum cordatum]|uniref:Protein kinase domain-containing protein n=1 Tax=Prorocentrum cordatum TaxID=2364126 RepID=A0ABN9TGV9_9DINO|nr:unnamed protein product [Polarella glacialis]
MPAPTADPRFVRPMPPAPGAAAAGAGCPAADGAAPGAGGEDVREVLRGGGFVAKVADFNTAVVCEPPDCRIWDAEGTQQFTPPESASTRAGTRPWASWASRGTCGPPAACFWGCSFLPRFRDEEPIRLQLALMHFAMDANAAVDVPSGAVSQHAEDIIRQLLHKDPARRPAAAAALQHPWVQ